MPNTDPISNKLFCPLYCKSIFFSCNFLLLPLNLSYFTWCFLLVSDLSTCRLIQTLINYIPPIQFKRFLQCFHMCMSCCMDHVRGTFFSSLKNNVLLIFGKTSKNATVEYFFVPGESNKEVWNYLWVSICLHHAHYTIRY